MNEPQSLALGGRKTRVTTLFCDIRGSSKIAEQTDPQSLVALLNEHFTAMTEILLPMKARWTSISVMRSWPCSAPIALGDEGHRAARPSKCSAGTRTERAPRGGTAPAIAVGHRHRFRRSDRRVYRLAQAHGFYRRGTGSTRQTLLRHGRTRNGRHRRRDRQATGTRWMRGPWEP